MATELTKNIKRELKIGGVRVMLTIKPDGLEFRKPNTRQKALVTWERIVKLYGVTDHGDRPLRGLLGIFDVKGTASESESKIDELKKLKKQNNAMRRKFGRIVDLIEENKKLKNIVKRVCNAVRDV